MYKLKNNFLTVKIHTVGAELCSIVKNDTQQEYIWNANPKIWGSHAPVLFPIIGALKDDEYTFEENTYNLPKHGFIRHNDTINCREHTAEKLTLSVAYNDSYFKIYPFKFEFLITYTLKENSVIVYHEIINHGDNAMYFSLGGHPAFKCPLQENERYEDYALTFEKNENAAIYLINEKGLLNGKAKPFLNNENTIVLSHKLFNNDALIFKDLQSKSITLSHKEKGDVLTVRFHDFPYLGIWAKPNGNFVCIEPWLGITDHENTDKNFSQKEGIVMLLGKQHYKAEYTIEIAS